MTPFEIFRIPWSNDRHLAEMLLRNTLVVYSEKALVCINVISLEATKVFLGLDTWCNLFYAEEDKNT